MRLYITIFKIQMRKLHRRIFMQQATLTADCDEDTANESQERIKHLCCKFEINDSLQIDLKLQMMIERVKKVKFIIAYISGCTLIELMLLMN